MNYREVKCSDRLPEKETEVKITLDATFRIEDGVFEIVLPAGCRLLSNILCFSENPEAWLEPYELPTEERIREIINNIADDRELYDGDGGYVHCSALFPDQWDEAIKAITNLLK